MAGSTRVGSLYYEVLLDPNGFARGATKIKREQKALMQVMQSMRNQMDPAQAQEMMHKQQLEAIRNARRANKITRDQARQMWNASVADHKRAMNQIAMDAKRTADRVIAEKKRAQAAGSFFGRSMAQANKLGQGILMMTSRFYAATIVIGLVARSMNAFAKAVSSAYMQVRVMTNLFGGSVTKAKELRSALVDYAQATAFSVEQTMQIATQLRALGFTADEIVPKIKMMGKLSFGDPQKMKFIAKAMSDVRAMGRLMSREVMQFANQGIPILSELAKTYGVTTAQLKTMIEAGQVSAKDTEEALERIASRYGDADTLGLETSQGQIQRLKEEFTAFMEQFPAFEDTVFLLVKSLADIVEWLTEMKKQWNESESLVVKFIGYFLNIAGAIRDIADTSSYLWQIWAKLYGAITGDSSWEDSIIRQREMNDLIQDRIDKAAEERDAEEERMKAELRAHEAAMANKKKEMDMNLRMAKASGNKKLVAELEARKKIYQAYLAGTKLAQRDGDGELLPGQDPHQLGLDAAEAMKQELLLDAKGDAKKDPKADKMFNLPQEIFKQNSIAEFRYLQEMRKNAKAEADAERRHQEKIDADKANSQAQIDAIDSIDSKAHVDDMNVAGI